MSMPEPASLPEDDIDNATSQDASTVLCRSSLPGAAERVIWTGGDATPDRIGVVDWTGRVGAVVVAGASHVRLHNAQHRLLHI